MGEPAREQAAEAGSVYGPRDPPERNRLMGTSGSSSGSGSDTPLVPSWLDGPDTGPLPVGDGPGTPDDGADEQDQAPGDRDGSKRPPIPPTAQPDRFKGART